MEEQPVKEEKTTKQERVATGWKRWLNYQRVVKQLPFFLFLTLLAVIYIYNGHYAEKTLRKISRTSREVKELQHEYKTVQSEVMFRSKQSELVKAVEPLGLKELTQSPAVLTATEDRQ
jgi:predicted membrane protein